MWTLKCLLLVLKHELYEPDYNNYQLVQLESGLLDLFFHYWCANKI